ncbi:MAG: DNA alkylation repair protein [Bacteroidetes bacterium]|nr:DNA alkylation repair protein [Bacteroidota bacterium]
MPVISAKSYVKPILPELIDAYEAGGAEALTALLRKQILKEKIKFPVLEYTARELFSAIPDKEQLQVCDLISDLHEIGGNVFLGIALQMRLSKHFNECFRKAPEYMMAGNEWYVCDIIGERVMGYALLMYPKKTIPVLKKLAAHPDKWVVRSVGVGAHYAIKKGLKKEHVKDMFELLLSLSTTTDFHTKKGIGWAAKTTAKFHPDIIQAYQQQITTSADIRPWFKTKIKIGLGRSSKYAKRHTG